MVDRLDGVEILVAPFTGVDTDRVLRVGDRRVTARVLFDASGWRALLCRALGAAPPSAERMSFGLETSHGHGGCDLEFWVRPEERPDGVFWAFPAGGQVREGVASYRGQTRGLRGELAGFAHEDQFPARAVHGGMFPARLRDPVWAGVFAVGDAAGQCLPLSAEGIRPAIVFGQEAGRRARQVLEGRVSLGEALGGYRASVLRHRRMYRQLERLQAGMLNVPLWALPAIQRRIACRSPRLLPRARSHWVADPDTIEVVALGCAARSGPARTMCHRSRGRPPGPQP